MPLTLPGTARPSNLHLRLDQMHWDLDGDTLAWLSNLPEEVQDGHRLFVVIHEDHKEPYVIMEHADDGSDMFVMRTDHLGADTYERLRYMRRVPLGQRLAKAEAENARFEKEHREHELDELYEKLGGPMYRQLHHDGFAHGRAENYPLRKGRRRAA